MTEEAEIRHKWEGEPCKYCRHNDSLHAKGKGMCFSPNCDCEEFKLDWRDELAARVAREEA